MTHSPVEIVTTHVPYYTRAAVAAYVFGIAAVWVQLAWRMV
jgi:hypothetical protein